MNLTPEQLAFIVMRIAVFERSRDIAKAFNEIWPQPRITDAFVRQQDPSRFSSPELDALRDRFFAVRNQFLTDIDGIPIASTAFRLNMLNAMLLQAHEAGHIMLAKELLEQAAKECGGMFTNKSRVELKTDAPKTQGETLPDLSGMTTDELRAVLNASNILGNALHGAAKPDNSTRH